MRRDPWGRMMRIAVIGLSGQVAQSLAERGDAAGVTVVRLGRPDIDLECPESIHRALLGNRVDAVVNAAAYTAVDDAEKEPQRAFAINAAGAGKVAEAAMALNSPILHLSTDYVFDGSKETPYREDDSTGPIGVYGASKLAGEQAVAAANPNHVILRTAWVYAPWGKNFVRTMLRLAETRDEVKVVADQLGNPTYAPDIADGVIAVARNLLASPGDMSLRGVFHMTGSGETTWFGLAEAVFAASATLHGLSANVVPIGTADYPTPARRPANSRLECTKLKRIHGAALPDWRQSVVKCIERLRDRDC